MKKQRLTLFVSALLALGLASCGGESAPASTPAETPASTATKTDTKTTTSKSTTSKSSTSKSTTPAPVARPYIKLPFNSFEGSEYTEESVNKWTKNFTYKWTFWTSRAEEGITVAIGAQLTDGSHADRSLYTNHEGASSSDTFESTEANDGTPRIVLANNGVKSEVTHMTYGEAGLTASELNYFEIGNIAVKEGKNVITITTHAQAGYRLNLGGEIRLLYQAGEADLQGQVQNPTYTISSVSLANEEDHAVLSYHVDYTVYDFEEVCALDWHAGFQGNQNAGGRNWDYTEITPLSYAQGEAAGEMLVKVNLDNLVPNNYSGKFGIGTVASGNNAGQAQDVHFAGDAAAYTSEITVGTKTYTFKADGGADYWNLPSLVVVDSAEPTYAVSEVGMSQVNNRAIVTWTISYSNYTLEDIQAMDWQGAFQENDNVSHKGWDWIEYGAEKANPISVVAAGVDGKAKIEMDVTDYDLNCYMGKLGVGLQTSGDNAGRAFDVRPEFGQNSSFQIGNKLYEFMPKGINDTFGLPSLFISHAHVYEEASALLNSADKPVSLASCHDDEAKRISLNFSDYTAISQTPDGTPSTGKVGWYLKKGSTVSWNVSVDKAISGAVIEFGMIATSPDHLGRHLYNEAKEDALHVIPDTDPVQYEEGYVKQNTAGTPDKTTEADWRVSVAVGDQDFPITNRKTMAENGAVQNQVCYVQLASIDLAAGDNVIKLSQNNIGYRMQFNGEVRIYYTGDATITGNPIPEPVHVHTWGEAVPGTNSDQKAYNTYSCTDNDDGFMFEMAIADASAISNGSKGSTMPSDGKLEVGATLDWKVVMPRAGKVAIKLGVKMGNTGHANAILDTEGYTFNIGDTNGTCTIPANTTYSSYGLDASKVVQVEFGTIDVEAGEQTLRFNHLTNKGNRLLFQGLVQLIYIPVVA